MQSIKLCASCHTYAFDLDNSVLESSLGQDCTFICTYVIRVIQFQKVASFRAAFRDQLPGVMFQIMYCLQTCYSFVFLRISVFLTKVKKFVQSNSFMQWLVGDENQSKHTYLRSFYLYCNCLHCFLFQFYIIYR